MSRDPCDLHVVFQLALGAIGLAVLLYVGTHWRLRKVRLPRGVASKYGPRTVLLALLPTDAWQRGVGADDLGAFRRWRLRCLLLAMTGAILSLGLGCGRLYYEVLVTRCEASLYRSGEASSRDLAARWKDLFERKCTDPHRR